MTNILVTGGAGFIGSHVAEFYEKKGMDVTVFDNLSRAQLLGKGYNNANYNWDYLGKLKHIKLIKGDVTNFDEVKEAIKDVDVIIHTAAQTAVTTSLTEPRIDFLTNSFGTFNISNAARRFCNNPAVIYCSTNKVYGNNVNNVNVIAKETRYCFEDRFAAGIPETFSIDLCEHTPYGCSKLSGDLYLQDYAHTYGLKTGIFRMSCIYGDRQFGVRIKDGSLGLQ